MGSGKEHLLEGESGFDDRAAVGGSAGLIGPKHDFTELFLSDESLAPYSMDLDSVLRSANAAGRGDYQTELGRAVRW